MHTGRLTFTLVVFLVGSSSLSSDSCLPLSRFALSKVNNGYSTLKMAIVPRDGRKRSGFVALNQTWRCSFPRLQKYNARHGDSGLISSLGKTVIVGKVLSTLWRTPVLQCVFLYLCISSCSRFTSKGITSRLLLLADSFLNQINIVCDTQRIRCPWAWF